MTDDELSMIWQKSAGTEVISFNKPALIADLNSQLDDFEKCLNKRDRREIIGSAIVIFLFGTGALFVTSILAKTGLVLGALYGILVILVLRYVKKQKPENDSLPVGDYLVKHRQYLVKQRNLLKNVIYWYLLPPFVSCVIFFAGLKMETVHLVISVMIVFVMYSWIYFLNKAGVKNTFDPLISRIDKAIDNIETSE